MPLWRLPETRASAQAWTRKVPVCPAGSRRWPNAYSRSGSRSTSCRSWSRSTRMITTPSPSRSTSCRTGPLHSSAPSSWSKPARERRRASSSVSVLHVKPLKGGENPKPVEMTFEGLAGLRPPVFQLLGGGETALHAHASTEAPRPENGSAVHC